MAKPNWGIIAILGGIAAWIYYQQSQNPGTASDSAASFSNDPISSVSDAVVAATAGWKNVGQGSTWLPDLNAAEVQYGIPTDLLARIAYQESHFRQDIIDGTTASSAGALGLMQLMPAYFPSVRVPRPFTVQDTQNQIIDAAQNLITNYNALGDWSQAVAAYNAGLSTIQKGNASAANKSATAKYVAQIMADLPNLNA